MTTGHIRHPADRSGSSIHVSLVHRGADGEFRRGKSLGQVLGLIADKILINPFDLKSTKLQRSVAKFSAGTHLYILVHGLLFTPEGSSSRKESGVYENGG